MHDFDLLAIGRSSIDLYANDVGVPFPEIESFGAFVGGCPANISVGVRRLGLRTALCTAIGEDPVGDFLLRFFNNEGVDTAFIPRKPDRRTSAVLLGIEPPDRFPLVFYRDNCADMALTIDDMRAAPIARSRAILVTGTGLSAEPSRSATFFAMELARIAGTKVILDIDFRADQWHDVRAFGVNLRRALPLADIIIGTEEELKAAALIDSVEIQVKDAQVSSPEVSGSLEDAVQIALGGKPEALVVKRGAEGATLHLPDGEVIAAAPFPVDVLNVLGAGDAFASGFLFGYLNDWNWKKCARMGNATGAIVVTRQGCANFMPTQEEALAFVEAKGGF